MKLVSLRADGTIHRVWPEVQVTADPWSFAICPGKPVEEADGRTWSSPYPVVAMFWPGAYYQVFLLLKEQSTDYYCNVIAPVSYRSQDQTVAFTDLDIDVVVSGQLVEVVDMEEFALRKSDYPEEWRREALRAKDELATMAKSRVGPFSPATANWWRAHWMIPRN
jgi:protein associated with RNAse G/E